LAKPTTFDAFATLSFLTFYSIECFLKLLVHRLYFFWNDDRWWNTLDISLVSYGYFEVVEGAANISWLRSLRLFRVAKVLRVLKLARSLDELRLILSCLTGCLMSLMWSIIMMMIIVFMFSLVFVQETASHFSSIPKGEDRDDALSESFGSVQNAMLTLYSAATGGQDWQVFYTTISETGELASIIFLFYIAFIQIAMWNILTGIFVEKALKSALPDRETLARDHVEEQHQIEAELLELCRSVDSDQSGTISPKEFSDGTSARLKEYLHYMGLGMDDIQVLFDLLSGSSVDQTVDIPDFIRACMRCRTGQAVDTQRLLCEMELNRRILTSHFHKLEGLLPAVAK
jgi:hypothetical protein